MVIVTTGTTEALLLSVCLIKSANLGASTEIGAINTIALLNNKQAMYMPIAGAQEDGLKARFI